MYLALSICVLFISLPESVNGAQFLNTTCILVSIAAAPSAEVSSTVIVIYHLFQLNFLFKISLVDLVYCVSLLLFDIPLKV